MTGQGGKGAKRPAGGAVTEMLLRQLLEALREHHVAAYDEPYDGKLYGPPPRGPLAEFMKKKGKMLPPSYIRFLRQHNGWKGYAGGFTLMGVTGRHTADARRDIKETIELFEDGWAAQYGKPTEESIAAFEARSRDEAVYVGRLVSFGTDFNGALLLFDNRRRRRDGEMDVLLWDSSGPSRRYRAFGSMLESDLKEIRRETRQLASRRKSRAAGPDRSR